MSKRSADDKGGDDANKKHKVHEATVVAATVLPSSGITLRPSTRPLDPCKRLTDINWFYHILSFLPLQDLNKALQASKGWYRGVVKMPSINATIAFPFMQRLAANKTGGKTLSQHVISYSESYPIFEPGLYELLPVTSSHILWEDQEWHTGFVLHWLEVTPQQLRRLSQVTSRLKELAVVLLDPAKGDSVQLKDVKFPLSLTFLEVHVPISNEINELILEASTQLHSLLDFRLVLQSGVSRVSSINFRPLRVRSESDGRSELEFYLELQFTHEVKLEDVEMTVEQINDIRAIKQNRLPCSLSMDPRLTRRLLQEPHNGWTSLSRPEAMSRMRFHPEPTAAHQADARLLLKLPNLTSLFIGLMSDDLFRWSNVPLIGQFINLTEFAVNLYESENEEQLSILLKALQKLNKLTSLTIIQSSHLSSADLVTLFKDHLRSLEKVKIRHCGHVHSLAFLEYPNYPPNLSELSISDGDKELIVEDQMQYLKHPPPKLNQLELHFQAPLAAVFGAAAWEPIRATITKRKGKFSVRFGPAFHTSLEWK